MPREKLRQRCCDIGLWVGDVLTTHPEGVAEYNDKAKEGVGLFTALLAFIGAQGGALALAEQYSIPRKFAFSLYFILSIIDIAAIARLIRMTENGGAKKTYYFDRATILYGRLVFYLAILSAIGFGYGYLRNALTPNRPPFPLTTIPMSAPEPLVGYSPQASQLTFDLQTRQDQLNLSRLTDAISRGLKGKSEKGKIFVSTSFESFEDEYGDFQLRLFPEVKDVTQCLVFLCSVNPTRNASSQLSLKQINLVGDPAKDSLTNIVEVRSPKKRDFVVVIFYSSEETLTPDHQYVLTKVSTL